MRPMTAHNAWGKFFDYTTTTLLTTYRAYAKMPHPTGASHAPERFSALRPPSFRVSEATMQNPGRGKRAAGTRWAV